MANTVDEELKKKAEEQENQTETTITEGQSPTNNSSGYSFDDVVSVADTGSLPSVNTTEKDPYTKYMEDFRSIYDKQVEANKKAAANKAAAANAEYNELNRNVNEINKANGRANTGYAGDTSIDAYNAYRNAVNEAYAQSEQSNNDLYAYYMQQMINLQQAKDSKEATDRQLELQEKEYNDSKTETILGTISEKLEDEGALNANGTIKAEKAQEIYDYLKDYYNGVEHIPKEVMATLNSTSGFKDWLNAYNNNTVDEYNNQNVLKSSIIQNSTSGSGENGTVGDDYGDNFVVKYNGLSYNVEVGSQANASITAQVKEKLENELGSAMQGAVVLLGDKLYAVTETGNVVLVIGRDNDTGDGARKLKTAIGGGNPYPNKVSEEEFKKDVALKRKYVTYTNYLNGKVAVKHR